MKMNEAGMDKYDFPEKETDNYSESRGIESSKRAETKSKSTCFKCVTDYRKNPCGCQRKRQEFPLTFQLFSYVRQEMREARF